MFIFGVDLSKRCLIKSRSSNDMSKSSVFIFLKSQLRSTRKVFVYKIQVNPIHTILKYGDYHDLWIGNSAVLKICSEWQLKEF